MSSNCTIQDSVNSFKEDFRKKIVGNSRTVKISNNNTLVTITPSNSSNSVQSKEKAFRMAQRQIQELDKLSKQYLGLKGSFRPGKIEVSPDGVVSYTVRPPFNMYRELLKKQEAIEAAKAKDIQETEARVQSLEKTKNDIASTLPDSPLRAEVVEGLEKEIQDQKNLFNYSQEVIDEVGQDAFFNQTEFPENPEEAYYNIQADDSEIDDLFNSVSDMTVSDEHKAESVSSYANHLIRYKEKLIENLTKKRKVIVEDAVATDDFLAEATRQKYLESVNMIDQLIEKTRDQIKVLKKKQEDKMIDILKDELSDIFKDLQGNMAITNPEELLATFTNKDIFSRLQLLEKFIPTSTFELSSNYSNVHKEFFETEEYGDFKGALSFAFTENPQIVKNLRDKIEQIQSLLNTRMDDILLEMVQENPIFLSKMSDVRGEGQKMSLEDFKKIINTELNDIGVFEANLTSMIENDSQMEEYLARAEIAFETRTEHIINTRLAEKAKETYERAIENLDPDSIPKGQTPGEVLSRKMYDRSSFGRKMVDKFTGNYGKLLGELKAKTKAIRYSSGLEAEDLYKDKIQTIALEHDVIKPHMLLSIKKKIEGNANMQNKLSYFTASDQEMEDYERELREKLGKDFERQVEKIYNSLVNWEFTENAALTGLTGNAIRRIHEDSPWDFASNFDRLNEEISLGITSGLYSTYVDEDGDTQKVLNNPSLKNMFLVPKGTPETNKKHFNQQFQAEIESSQEIYDSWKDLNEYNQYSAPRVGQGFNTISRARKDGTEVLSKISGIKDLFTKGMHKQALKELFRFIADAFVREKFSTSGVHLYNSNGITTHFSDSSVEDINLRTKALMVQYPYEALRQKLLEEGVRPYISAEDYRKSKIDDPAYKVVRTDADTDETFAKKELNRDAKIAREYHKIMAKTLASEEIHAKFNTDILQNSMAQGNMAALQRGAEKSLSSARVLQAFMAERNLRGASESEGKRTISKRARAEKRFNTWIETDIKNNRKGLNKTVIRKPNTGDFELDAELAKNKGNREIKVKSWNFLHKSRAKEEDFENLDGSTPEGRMKINTLRGYKFYEEAQKDYLDTLNAVLKGELESGDFSFKIHENIDGTIRKVDYRTDYKEDGSKMHLRRYQIKVLGDNGAEKIESFSEEITEDAYTSALGLHFSSAAARMGREVTLAGFLGEMGKAFSFSSLAFSALVGTKNRLEGKASAMLEAERQGDAKQLREANHFMSGYNRYRLAGRTKSKVLSKFERAQFKTLDMFVEKLDVFQDKKDFIQRMTNEESSIFTNAFGFGIDLPERKNQLPLLLKNAAEMFLKDKDGNSVAIFGNNEFQIYMPGTLKLKPEFREGPEGKKNIEIWENFGANTRVRGQANPALDLSIKTTADIINSQGNFSDQDSLAIFEKPLGSLLLLFNRWFGSRANRMFISKEHLNPLTGVQGSEAYISSGRMLSSAPLVGGYGALIALQVATPGVAGAVALGSLLTGAVMSANRNKKAGGKRRPTKQFQMETLALLSETMARFVTFPVQYFGNSKRLNVIDSDWFQKVSPLEKLLQEDKISPKEAGRIRLAGASLATSMGMSAVTLGMRMLLNSSVIDSLIDNLTEIEDDDTEEEKDSKRTRENILYTIQMTLGYGLENTMNNLQSSAFGEFNFINFLKDRSNLPLLGSLQKMQREANTFGDDGFNDNDSSVLTSSIAVLNALGISTVPSQVSNAINFYKTEGKEGRIGFMQNKVYMPNSWTNKYFIKQEMESEDVIMNLMNKDGFGLRNKIKKEYVEAAADERGIWFRSWNKRYDELESAVDQDNKYLSKKKNETYLEMAKRIHRVLEEDMTIKQRGPFYIKELEDAIELAETKLATEKEKAANDHNPKKKYKATPAEVARYRKTLQDYEDRIESKYKPEN